MAQFANGALGSLVRSIINGLSTKTDLLTVTAATDLDLMRQVSDEVDEWRTEDPANFQRIADLDIVLDLRTGDRTLARLSLPDTVKILWQQNTDYAPPDFLGPNDEWPGYPPGTIIQKSLASASENLLAVDAGKVLVASGVAATLNIQTEATEAIVRSAGQLVGWIVQNDTAGNYTIQAPVGVTLNDVDNGSYALAAGARASLINKSADVFEIWVA